MHSAITPISVPNKISLFYNTRNNRCQIWWFKTTLGKAIFNYDNDDDVVLVRPLTRKMKGSGKGSPCWLCPFGNLLKSYSKNQCKIFVCFSFISTQSSFKYIYPHHHLECENMKWHSLSQFTKTQTQPYTFTSIWCLSYTPFSLFYWMEQEPTHRLIWPS